MKTADVILVGAGWSHCLLAWRLLQKRPGLRLRLLEAKSGWDTNRTWSFHRSDIVGSEWLLDLVSRSWSSCDVVFPRYMRSLEQEYCSIRAEEVARKLEPVLSERVSFNCSVRDLAHDHVRLQDGSVYDAGVVLDGRGQFDLSGRLGFQKFVGLDLELCEPHGLTCPILMDARVSQVDGYRFFYVLPWNEKTLLVEDTRYSLSPLLQEESMLAEIHSYASGKGWRISKVLRRESGVLPLPLDLMEEDSSRERVARLGLAGGFFHPVTGYSTADAARIADLLSDLPELNTGSVVQALEWYRRSRVRQNDFFRLLNRMMFLAAPDSERIRIFERFYGLSENLISRFYAGNLRRRDQLRLLIGKPPVPLLPALRCLGE